jgi:protoporphyrinogen oxidase
MSDVSVIGAGLSGLATAWYLAEAGAHVRVLEASAGPGGLIQTSHQPEGMVEAAARAFTWNDRAAALFRAMDVAPCFAREQSRRRYIYRGGRARRWPLTPLESARTAAHNAPDASAQSPTMRMDTSTAALPTPAAPSHAWSETAHAVSNMD